MFRMIKTSLTIPGRRRVGIVATLAVAAALAGASSASAAELIDNGGFETGTLTGWQATSQTGKGGWFIYNRKEQGEKGVPAFPPAGGEYAAQDSFDEPDSVILSQEVALPAGTTDELSMNLFYSSSQPLSTPSPDTLEVKGPGGESQQLRVDVLKAGAPLTTLAPTDILATVFATQTGSPQILIPTVLRSDLSAFAGQTVILRIANSAERGDMETGIDEVSIASTPIPPPVVTPPPGPAPSPPPSNLFTNGKLRLNKKNGSGVLIVNVPGAGTLSATDARRKVAIASRRGRGKAKPIYVKTATVSSGAAGTIEVPIRPTPAARKVLRRKGSLAVRLSTTFTPTGGTAATQAYAGKLVERLRRPAPR